MTSTQDVEPIAPSEEDRRAAQAVQALLEHINVERSEQAPRLLGTAGEALDLPEALVRVLVQAARQLARGNALTVVPLSKELTSQEAADILNVSRPYLIKLLEQGDIPYVKTGTHRRIRLSDVMAYKRIRDAERRRSLARLTQMSQEMGLYDEQDA